MATPFKAVRNVINNGHRTFGRIQNTPVVSILFRMLFWEDESRLKNNEISVEVTDLCLVVSSQRPVF